MKNTVKYGEFESKISDLIVSVQRIYFTNYAVAKILKVEKSTVDKQIERESIPSEYFEKYLAAWKKVPKKPQTPIWSKAKDSAWNKLKDEAINIVEDILSSLEPYYQMDYDNELFYVSILEDGDTLNGKSARFPYLIDKCFDAFTALTSNDVLFFSLIFDGKQSRREAVLQEMAKAEMFTPSQIISMLTSKEGKNWLQACELYSSEINVQESVQTCWNYCADKIKKWRKDYTFLSARTQGQAYQDFYFRLFLSLIWPKDDADDTEFGAEEIKALITFKYFLTEKARQELIDRFCEEQPED